MLLISPVHMHLHRFMRLSLSAVMPHVCPLKERAHSLARDSRTKGMIRTLAHTHTCRFSTSHVASTAVHLQTGVCVPIATTYTHVHKHLALRVLPFTIAPDDKTHRTHVPKLPIDVHVRKALVVHSTSTFKPALCFCQLTCLTALDESIV